LAGDDWAGLLWLSWPDFAGYDDLLGRIDVSGDNRRVDGSNGADAMSIFEILILLLVAGICGSIGQALGGYSRGGCLVSIVLGFVGAPIGMWLKNAAGLPELIPVTVGGRTFPIVWSVIGAALFVALLGLLTRSRRV